MTEWAEAETVEAVRRNCEIVQTEKRNWKTVEAEMQPLE
jgi:hypothetical protein